MDKFTENISNRESERKKWDRYYASLPLVEEDEATKKFNEGFAAEQVSELLPPGSCVLEAGCGGGWQSLALARLGKYNTSLMDFSQEALKYAQRLFERENLKANFIYGDVLDLGKPEYDLVFNAGVLEHYTFDQQVAFLRGMASRSRKYVLVLVPNRLCYWYWLWRVQKSGNAAWPFGKETPVVDLSAVFTTAGLHFLGQMFMGEAWTEAFINGLDGMAESVCNQILKIHRSPLVPKAEKSYLVAALGSVTAKVSAVPGQWEAPPREESIREAEIYATLGDALALRINAEWQLAQLRAQLAANERQLTERDQRLQTMTSQLAERVAERDGQIASLSQAVTELERARSEVLHSTSWRITKPARFLLRVVRYGLSDQDKAQIRILLRNQYRRLPLPFKLKNALRTTYFRLTGWSSHTPLVPLQSASSLARGIQAGTLIQSTPRQVSQKSTLAVSCEAPSQIKPYFGVRRPHGKRRAAILTNQLLDWHDGRPRFGGGERYALELARLLRELSIDVTFFQPSLRPAGSGDYYSFEVKFLPLGDSVGEFHYGVCSCFTALTAEYDHVYYHMPEYASGTVREDGLMTCHGIWFDHNNYPDSIYRTPSWFEQLSRAFRNPLGIVSVDTNSIGVIRSLWPDVAQKMRYIPNFYDAGSYYPDSTKRNPQRLTILFPRRSQINRGSRIFSDIVDRIPHDVDIIWLGEGDPMDVQIIKAVCARDKRVSFHVANFDQMPTWYQKADIVVIPTLACEGTSLSCIEALACGCAVVATNVGGLPNVVYDGINGLLVEPEASSLADAINRLITDRALRERLQRSGAETVSNFELRIWRARWVELLRSFGWISDDKCSAWFAENQSVALVTHPTKDEKWVILTRNATHGGVESLIREEAKLLAAPVIVCGSHDRKDTCPFKYSRADNVRALEKAIADYGVILYHWLPDWALEVIRKSHKRCIEFVHRTDTSGSDKTVPTALVTHSAFLAKFIHETYGRRCRVVDHPIALDQFVPQPELGPCIGAITSYYKAKGIDIFLRAWALLKHEFPNVPVRFYGAGDDLHGFKKLAYELGIDAEFREATREPWRAMQEFRCFVVPSRIEGLPVAILEALAMNIPVVASALPGMLEFNELAIRRGYEGYVDLANPEDPEGLACVIRAVLKSSERKDSNLYIRDYYSPQKHCSDLVSVLREIRRH